MTGRNRRPPSAEPPPASADSRAERLAAALRANLSRRKAQSRARRAGAPDGTAEVATGALPEGLDFAIEPGDKDGEAEPERR